MFPLYSDLSDEETDRAINLSTSNKIRVIVSTNVAEASITVEGVIYVIDSGVENQAQWETEDTTQRIKLERISKANAMQRFGRSGRTMDGEVYTLYTEKQFDSMLAFPVPAIQRSSMEDIILRLQELGIEDYESNWIDAPQSNELSRAIASLKTSGAIDSDNKLTEYGELLSKFHYPSTLADLIIMADRLGCAVEVATVLPIIKSGGHKTFLLRETSWDEPTKKTVEKIQEILWQGCKDDVEFIFRMYSFWQNPPDISEDGKGGKKSLSERRAEFAKAFFVNFDMFEEDIEPEREKILKSLIVRNKNQNIRSLQFGLLDRVRMILAYSIPFVIVTEGKYVYNPRLEVFPGAAASCQLAISEQWGKKIKELKDKNVSPLKFALESGSLLQNQEPLESVLKRLLTKPVLPKSDRKAFDDFIGQYKVNADLLVEVVGYAEHAGDYRVSLVVKEPVSGYETWLTPSDISFTQSSAVVKQIPVGTKLHVWVKSINTGKSFVQLSCLPLVEVELEKTYDQQKKINGKIVTRAKVIDVRNDKKIVFIAELSRPAEGFVMVIHANEKILGKPSQDFKVGDVCLVSFVQDTGFDFKSILNVAPEGFTATI